MKLSRDNILHKLNWFMENLPSGFKQNDQNDPNYPPVIKNKEVAENMKDAGPLERFTEAFMNELDEKLIPKIEGLKYLNDPQNIDLILGVDHLGLLRYIAWLWGDVRYETFQTYEQYKDYLAYAVHIHRARGSINALNMFLGLFGLRVNPGDHKSYRKATSRYDIGLRYDTVYENLGNEGLRYDYNSTYRNGCTDCAIEQINITVVPGNNYTEYSEEFRENLATVIEDYLTPVNVKLGITFTLPRGLVTRLRRYIKTRETNYITILHKFLDTRNL